MRGSKSAFAFFRVLYYTPFHYVTRQTYKTGVRRGFKRRWQRPRVLLVQKQAQSGAQNRTQKVLQMVQKSHAAQRKQEIEHKKSLQKRDFLC